MSQAAPQRAGGRVIGKRQSLGKSLAPRVSAAPSRTVQRQSRLTASGGGNRLGANPGYRRDVWKKWLPE